MKNHYRFIKSGIVFSLLLSSFSMVLSAQTWTEMNSPPFHKHHSNGFGFNGKGYVFEGTYENDGPNNVSNEVWEYTPETDSWVRLQDFPGEARAIAIGDDWDGKYYYGFGSKGGQDGLLNDLWVFDPVDTSFTQLPSCPCQGRTHPAFVAQNDKIFVGTGSTWNGDLNDWWEYDMITQQWTQRDNVPGSIRHHPFQFGIGNFIYVGGGHAFNWEKFDITTGTWSSINEYPEGRVAGSQFSHNGMGYIIGGDDASHSHVPAAQSFMRYNTALDKWEPLPVLPNGSRWAPSSFIIGDDLYFFGGLSSNIENDSTMWKLDLLALDNPVSTNSVEEDVEDQFMAFPNPFQDKIKIETGAITNKTYQLNVINAQGKILFNIDKFHISNEIDLSSLPKGFYFLQLDNEEESISLKIVKEN